MYNMHNYTAQALAFPEASSLSPSSYAKSIADCFRTWTLRVSRERIRLRRGRWEGRLEDFWLLPDFAATSVLNAATPWRSCH